MAKLSDLSLSKEQMLAIVQQALTWKDIAVRLGRNNLNGVACHFLQQKYGLNIPLILKSNKLAASKQRKADEENKIVTCNKCGKKYRNGDRPSHNKSNHFFCSDQCARAYSANVNKDKARVKIAQSLKKFYERKRKLEGRIDKTCKICGAARGKCIRPEICKHRLAFNNYIKYMGFNPATLGSIKAYAEFERLKAKIQTMYFHDGMSTVQIYNYFKNLYGYPLNQGSFYKLLIHFLPTRRSSIEGVMCRIQQNGPIVQGLYFKAGIHKTWFGKEIQYRSSYELELCKNLDNGKIFYTVEPFYIRYFDTQTKTQRYAIPDFYLPEFNVIIEVKSEFTLNKQNMLDKINAYLESGYDFVLEYEHKSYGPTDVQHIQINHPIITDFKK